MTAERSDGYQVHAVSLTSSGARSHLFSGCYNFLMPLLIAALLIVPLLELAVILQVGSWIGFWPTVVLLLVDSVLGAVLLRSQGSLAWRRLREAIESRRLPHREAADGALVVMGGALLLTPGFLTDLAGLLLMVRPVRDLLSRTALARGMDAAAAGAAGPAGLWGVRSVRFGARAYSMRYGTAPRQDFDAEGSASEEAPELPERAS